MCVDSAVKKGHVYSSNQKETRRIFMCCDMARKNVQADIQFMRHKMSRLCIPRGKF